MRANIVRHESMMVNYAETNGWTAVEVDGDVDAHTAPMVREAVLKLLDEGHRCFVLDMSFVGFMDSMGLGVIVAITKRLRENDGALRITSASVRLRRVFQLSGMGDSYEFYDSVEEATQSAPPVGSLTRWPQSSR